MEKSKVFFLLSCLTTSLFWPRTVFSQTPTPFSGIGQCWWVTNSSVYRNTSAISWGYSSSQVFNFSAGGGDSWAAVEMNKGVYNFAQMRDMVNFAKASGTSGKKVWLQLQVAANLNKEQNIPRWAVDGQNNDDVEAITRVCGDTTNGLYWKSYNSSSRPTYAEIKPYVNNSLYSDLSEAVTDNTTYIKYPRKQAAIWDFKFREYYFNALRAMKKEFQEDIDSGTVAGFVLFSGGESGEGLIAPKCPYYDQATCTPDVVNPSCPVVQSMARMQLKEGGNPYPSDSQVLNRATEIAKRSTCDLQNTVPGNTVEVCTESDQNKCPVDSYGRPCYVFDDYWIQSVKQLVEGAVEIFAPLPVVWQAGSGLSWNYSMETILKTWFNEKYGNFVWLKWNGWSPLNYKQTYSRYFGGYTNTMHGYETRSAYDFSKSYARSLCEADLSCKFPDSGGLCGTSVCCTTEQINTCYENWKSSIREMVYAGITYDKSSFMCMADSFFSNPSEYFFGASDYTTNCANSEIKAISTTGSGVVGWCPGYLLSELKKNAFPYNCSPVGDLNCNKKVDLVDIQAILRNYLTGDMRADLDGSKEVNAIDASLLLKNYGK